jgi:hypothetical protein
MGQPACLQCGQAVAPAAPPVPGLEFQLEAYAGKIRALSVFWFVYAGLSVVIGMAGMAFAHAFFSGAFGPWMRGPRPPMFFFGPAFLHLAWLMIGARCILAVAAGWGLWERTTWGRMVAIIAAFICLLKFPFGTALGIWTLVLLLGYRNTTLYEQQ